jgi:hypothetical protein
MSSIIESAARGLKNSLPGIGVGQEVADRQRARGHDLIKNLALGGLALGGGTGALVALANYLKSMSEEGDLENASRLDDETLYIPEPKNTIKQAMDAATVDRWTAPGLAITGGILSAGGAYALTQAVYNYLQKKHRQQLLDKAQGETLAAADLEATKSAGASMTFSDLVTAFPVAVPLLAALATGGVAYAALNKAFPTVGSTKSKYPKRIRAVTPSGEVEPLDKDIAQQAIKSASEADCEAAAFEFLALMTDRVAMKKKATCITSDILNSVAKGGVGELAKFAHDQNLEAITYAVKGASDQPADSGMKAVAAAAIFKSARLSPLVSCIAAAEYIDMLPGVAQACASMDEERMDKAAGLGALLHISLSRHEILQEFSKAASSEHMPTALRELIGSLRHSPHQKPDALAEDEEDRDVAMTSDLSGSMGEDFEGGDNKDPDSDDESQADKDVIDAFMENPKSVPPPKH